MAHVKEFHRWTTVLNVKLLLPPRQSRGASLGRLESLRGLPSQVLRLRGLDCSRRPLDGGWLPESAQWPETTIDVPVGAIQAFDMVADNPGDWAFHCHKTHHAMNAMGHDVKNFIGVQSAT
jgi:Multicopper oxidase